MFAEISQKTTILLVIFLCYCKAEDQQIKRIMNSANKRLTLENTPIEFAKKFSNKTSSATPMSYEYLQTPNFNCLLLPEEAKNPQWKKYAALFDPPKILSKTTRKPKVCKTRKQRKRVQRKNSTQTFTKPTARPVFNSTNSLSLLSTAKSTSPPPTVVVDQILPPTVSISLERRIVETMFELLEKKNHIIVLQPRHCHADQSKSSESSKAMMIKNDRADFRNFAQSLLQKLMQQLKNPNSNLIQPMQGTTETIDPAVQRILNQLDREEEILMNKIYNKLIDGKPIRPKRYSGSCLHCKKNKTAGKEIDVISNAFESKSANNATVPEKKEATRSVNDCDKGYVFLLGGHSEKGKDLLMRTVRIVNKEK